MDGGNTLGGVRMLQLPFHTYPNFQVRCLYDLFRLAHHLVFILCRVHVDDSTVLLNTRSTIWLQCAEPAWRLRPSRSTRVRIRVVECKEEERILSDDRRDFSPGYAIPSGIERLLVARATIRLLSIVCTQLFWYFSSMPFPPNMLHALSVFQCPKVTGLLFLITTTEGE